ncbi:MAG: helix-turn-helix domain-containing protein [Verrucomicrobia bacterium]|jgi:cytoskeletal protein RodZ|nr:helix-turn-helix domain-containing protein [Verrucomicrobiota bacterium]MDD4455389.1 helix-turn-helix domain-containing protein [Candidatus Methanomethylophilaceae archaeon]
MSSVGEQLRRAREARGLTVEQIAEETKLMLAQVKALESGDYSAFPAMVYTRGSIKSYADVVKIDPTPLLEQLKEELQGKTGDVSQPYSENMGEDGLFWRLLMAVKTVMPLVVIALILGGAVIGYTLWKNQQGKDPLMALGNGRYEGATQAEHVVETLSLPPLP